MRKLSCVSAICLFTGLALMFSIGGMVAWEAFTGRPLFDYRLLPDFGESAGETPAPAEKTAASPDGSPAEKTPDRAAPADAAPDKDPAADIPEVTVNTFSVTSSWENHGDLRLEYLPRLRGFTPKAYPFYIAAAPRIEPLEKDNPCQLEFQMPDWQRERVKEVPAAAREFPLEHFAWVAFGACTRLPDVKGKLRAFYPGAAVRVAWDGVNTGNGKTLEAAGCRFTLRARHVKDGQCRVGVEFSVPEAGYPWECFARGVRLTIGENGTAIAPDSFNCRRGNGRLEGNMEFSRSNLPAGGTPPGNWAIALSCHPTMEETEIPFRQKGFSWPALPGGRHLPPFDPNDPPFKGQAGDRRLAATHFNIRREFFTDGRAPSKIRCNLRLRLELGDSPVMDFKRDGEWKCPVAGAAAGTEARIRYEYLGWERNGRRAYFQLEWQEEPRDDSDGERTLEGSLPLAVAATEWHTVELSVNPDADGRPVVPQENAGVKLTRANERRNGWWDYSLEIPPEVMPEKEFNLAAGNTRITLVPATDRPVRPNLRRQGGGRVMMNFSFRRNGALPGKITLSWPTATAESALRFSLPALSFPERTAPAQRELF